MAAQDEEHLGRRTAVGAVWSAAQAGGGRVLSVPVFVILARLLSPADFGLVALATTYIAILLALQAGLPSAIVQRRELERDHLTAAFWSGLALGVAVAAVTYVAAPVAASVLHEPRLTSVLRWMAFIPAFTGLDIVPQGLFLRNLEFRPLAMRSFAAITVGGVVGIGMAVAGLGVWALVGKAVSEQITRTTVLWLAVDHRPRIGFSSRHFADLWGVSSASLSSRFADVAREHLDDLLVGVVLGSTALGYYTVAYRLLVIFETIFVETTSKVSLPAFSRVQVDPAALVRAFRKSVRLSSSIAFPAFVGLASVAGLAVPVLFGPQWTPSVPAMRWLAIAGLFSAPSLLCSSALVARGHARDSAALHVGHLVATVLAVLVAVRFGITAVAAAYALSCLALTPLWLRALRHHVGVGAHELLDDMRPFAAAAIVMSTTVVVLQVLPGADELTAATLLIMCVATGGLLYVGALSALARTRVREIVDVAKVLVGR